jgi:pimeloyl-ACP methyl ester carboxylesterase
MPPYYRQADAAYVLTSPLATQNKIVSGTPTTDVTTAFDYYLKHYNHGRPFILAGHSQGSNVLLFVMARYLVRHPAAYHRMIAAYIVGYGVTHNFLAKNSRLKFAQAADDTGVIVSWNTEAPGLTIKNPVVQSGAIAINPITWTRSERPASAADSMGSLMADATGALKKVNHYADARVDKRRGVVVCSTCDVSVLSPGGPGSHRVRLELSVVAFDASRLGRHHAPRR